MLPRKIRKLTEARCDSGAKLKKLVKNNSKPAQKNGEDKFQSPEKKQRTGIKSEDFFLPPITPPRKSAKDSKSRKINTLNSSDSFSFRDVADADLNDPMNGIENPSGRQRIVKMHKSFATESKHDLLMQKNKTSSANFELSSPTSLSDSLYVDLVNKMDESQKSSFEFTKCNNPTLNSKGNNQRRKDEYTGVCVQVSTKFEDDEREECKKCVIKNFAWCENQKCNE